MGSVIATGENSFTYTTDKDGELFNSWEEEFEAFNDESDGFVYKVYHENSLVPGEGSKGMLISKDLKTKKKEGKLIRENLGLE